MTLGEENLLSGGTELKITKRFRKLKKPKPQPSITVLDYEEEDFQNLCSKKEKELNELGDKYGLNFTKSGRSITNRDKRSKLREKAEELNIPKSEVEIALNDYLLKIIWPLLPVFILFSCDTRLDVEETSFQKEFRLVIEKVVTESVTTKDEMEENIRKGLKREFDRIHKKMLQYTDTVTSLTPKPIFFQWDKLVKFNLEGGDEARIEVPLDLRGAGTRRLLMVAFFQYLAERSEGDEYRKYIFAIEEPETFLHPGLQRDLVEAFHEIAENGLQVIITSHSPVFAGSVEVENLILIMRKEGIATTKQVPELDLEEVADELGIHPRDQIIGYNALVFVEGIGDVTFLENIARIFKQERYIKEDFDDKKIGIIICGGDNLRHHIERKALKNLGRNFGVMWDSDRESESDVIKPEKLKWKAEVEKDGGKFFILKKREIENYLHPDVFKRKSGKDVKFDDYADIKALGFGKDVYKMIGEMTAEEILERDRYHENGEEGHELLEIISTFMDLTELQKEKAGHLKGEVEQENRKKQPPLTKWIR